MAVVMVPISATIDSASTNALSDIAFYRERKESSPPFYIRLEVRDRFRRICALRGHIFAK